MSSTPKPVLREAVSTPKHVVSARKQYSLDLLAQKLKDEYYSSRHSTNNIQRKRNRTKIHKYMVEHSRKKRVVGS